MLKTWLNRIGSFNEVKELNPIYIQSPALYWFVFPMTDDISCLMMFTFLSSNSFQTLSCGVPDQSAINKQLVEAERALWIIKLSNWKMITDVSAMFCLSATNILIEFHKNKYSGNDEHLLSLVHSDSFFFCWTNPRSWQNGISNLKTIRIWRIL